MSRAQTVAICFCGAAKTQSLGIPLIAAMWTHTDALTTAYIEIPVVLYTMEQVFLAQGFVYLFRWYLRRERDKGEPEAEIQQGDDVHPAIGTGSSTGQDTKEAPLSKADCDGPSE